MWCMLMYVSSEIREVSRTNGTSEGMILNEVYEDIEEGSGHKLENLACMIR